MSGSLPIVIDLGSSRIRAGSAGQQLPDVDIPSIVGVPKHDKVLPSSMSDSRGGSSEVFLGDDAQKHRGICKISYPMQHGTVVDWDSMEQLLNHTLDLLSFPNGPVLMTEAPFTTRKQRKQLAQYLFEKRSMPFMHFATQAVLGLFSVGLDTGVVMDIGDGVTQVVPVVEGYSISQSIKRIDLGGSDVTDRMMHLLRESGQVFHTSAEREMVREMKEQVGMVSLPLSSSWQHSEQDRISYVLPDGHAFDIATEHFLAPEVLFQPDILGLEHPGIHQLLHNAIKKADHDLRTPLYKSIILTGGTSNLKDLPNRVLWELRKIAPHDMKIKVKRPSECQYAAWIGGSLLARLDSFSSWWISKQEYAEKGDSVFDSSSF